jgi:hypothetical protein
MFLYAYVAYLVAFEHPDWESINFEHYKPEVCPNRLLFLSTDRVTPDVCLNECFSSFFVVTLLPAFFICVAVHLSNTLLLTRKSYVISTLLTCKLQFIFISYIVLFLIMLFR